MNEAASTSTVGPPTDRRSIFVRVVLGLLAALSVGVILIYVLNPSGTASADPRMRVLGIAPYRVASASMMPTLRQGDIVIVSTIGGDDPLRVGELIVFRPPNAPREAYLARVAGLPGDRVRIEDGRTWVNDRQLVEPFLSSQTLSREESLSMAELQVPEGALFVLGDNRDNAYDSRYWGPASLDQVEGRIRVKDR